MHHCEISFLPFNETKPADEVADACADVLLQALVCRRTSVLLDGLFNACHCMCRSREELDVSVQAAEYASWWAAECASAYVHI
jgi:hypothetical protein